MKYFNNICLDCRYRILPKQGDKAKCGVQECFEPNVIMDYDIEALENIDSTTDEILENKCPSFNDRHTIPSTVYCDYGKYNDEMNLIHRITGIINSDLGYAEFEGALLDYLRNNANDRINKRED